jgi:alkylation response protein AidB-like acyl-CoA dehydrogenase
MAKSKLRQLVRLPWAADSCPWVGKLRTVLPLKNRVIRVHWGCEQDRVAPDCLSGQKIICLAITEPYAGSDVASLRCTARKDPTGQFYVVNGEKKWITNGAATPTPTPLRAQTH